MLHTCRVTALAHHTARVTAAYALLSLSWWQPGLHIQANSAAMAVFSPLDTNVIPGFQYHSAGSPVSAFPTLGPRAVLASRSSRHAEAGSTTASLTGTRPSQSMWSDVLVAGCLVPASCCYLRSVVSSSRIVACPRASVQLSSCQNVAAHASLGLAPHLVPDLCSIKQFSLHWMNCNTAPQDTM